MFGKFLTSIFGSRNERTLKGLHKIVDKINKMEPEFEALTDEQLKAKTQDFKARLAAGETLDDILPEAFDTVRETSKRVFGMRHFDVQLIGGMVLNQRCIAEMRTGEGKTLTATLPAYLNALTGKGVHVVTVNDYLAQRDAANNRPLFEFLGLTVGVNMAGMTQEEKRAAYNADITYGTNNEYGFDYLRENMVFTADEKVQREQPDQRESAQSGAECVHHVPVVLQRKRKEVHRIRVEQRDRPEDLHRATREGVPGAHQSAVHIAILLRRLSIARERRDLPAELDLRHVSR